MSDGRDCSIAVYSLSILRRFVKHTVGMVAAGSLALVPQHISSQISTAMFAAPMANTSFSTGFLLQRLFVVVVAQLSSLLLRIIDQIFRQESRIVKVAGTRIGSKSGFPSIARTAASISIRPKVP